MHRNRDMRNQFYSSNNSCCIAGKFYYCFRKQKWLTNHSVKSGNILMQLAFDYNKIIGITGKFLFGYEMLPCLQQRSIMSDPILFNRLFNICYYMYQSR